MLAGPLLTKRDQYPEMIGQERCPLVLDPRCFQAFKKFLDGFQGDLISACD
jgi:hypothetical protein